MNDAPIEPVKPKRGRKPKSASLTTPVAAATLEAPVVKKVGRPAGSGTKGRTSQASAKPVAKTVVQTPNAAPVPTAAVTPMQVAPAISENKAQPQVRAQAASRPVVQAPVSPAASIDAKQEAVSLWKRMGIGLKVIIVLVAIGIVASLIKHF